MLKVLLVDDEILALEDIQAMVDWEKLGYEIVGATTSTRRAVELYQEHFPHLLITDIVMPAKSGVELGRELLAYGRPLKIFFLTSYQEFSYAKEGIRLGVSEYLVKSELDAESLGAALRRAKEEIEGGVFCEDRIKELIKELTNMSSDELRQAEGQIQDLFYCVKKAANQKYLNTLKAFLINGMAKMCSDYGGEYDDFLNAMPGKGNDVYELEDWFTYCRDEFQEVEKAHIGNGRFSMRKIVAYIRRHYHENLTIQLLADLFYVSTSHLKKVFKEETGYTIMDYVTFCRMEHARELLKCGKYRVGEIASLCGYATPQYFSKVFKESTGCTPFQFQTGGELRENTDKID